MASLLQLRRDTAANWISINPILAQGELGLDLTNNDFKIGDGIKHWNDLSFIGTSSSVLNNFLLMGA